MENSNKAIAKRINNELRIRGWSQSDLLRKIIKYKNPQIGEKLYAELNKKKGNFSTTLKGNDDRSFSKEDLYVISKIFEVPFEYIWFGENKKSEFKPSGPRYAAYQDNENEYRAYVASLEYEDRVQYPDEFGFNLFDYLGQFNSINGYKFFINNYRLHFDYLQYGELAYINSDGYLQLCSTHDRGKVISDNLIMVLSERKEAKTFKEVYFDNCSIKRFNSDYFNRLSKELFSEYFLETLLQNESFLDLVLKTKELELNALDKRYEKGEKRVFVEPMLFNALSYALEHENDYKDQLLKMLSFALSYNKHQYEFIKDYLKNHKEEYSDIQVNRYAPRFLVSARYVPMGNVFRSLGSASDKDIDGMLREIEQYAFNMTHIFNEQEKNKEEIKISTPDNELFAELNKNAKEQNIGFIPAVVHSDKEFTYFRYYNSSTINYESVEHLQFIIDCLKQAQSLVAPKANKVLVHGNLIGAVLMNEDGKMSGVAGWHKCHYGSKYDDCAYLLSRIDMYIYGDDYLKKFNTLFQVISKGFDPDEKVKLVDKAISLLNEERKAAIKEESNNHSTSFGLKQRVAKLEYFRELYLEK